MYGFELVFDGVLQKVQIKMPMQIHVPKYVNVDVRIDTANNTKAHTNINIYSKVHSVTSILQPSKSFKV